MTKHTNPDDLVSLIEDNHTATKQALEAAGVKMSVLTEQVATLEQRVLEGGGGTVKTSRSAGDAFVADERVKSFLAGDPTSGKVDLRIKANLTSLTTDAAGSVGDLGAAPYRDTPVLMPRRRLRVRNLMPVVQISSGSVEWPNQKGRTDNADMVAEGASKPQSDIQFEMENTTARVIAHWMKASRQVLSDAPQLKGVIDTELLDGLGLKEEAQLLNGDGTGQNLNGLIPQATAYSAPISLADINIMDVIALAMLQITNSYFEPDGVILNPADWLAMRTLKNSDGDYIFGPPNVAIEPRIFGLPVVVTPAMTSRKFLVGQFQTAATIYDRWEARVELGFVNDDFVKNMVTVLGEERLAFAVKRPAALVYGDFDTALAA